MCSLDNRGFTLLSVILSALILSLSILAFSKTTSSVRAYERRLNEAALATNYGSELLEFFRANTNQSLRAYLSVNPFIATNSALQPYFLCAHINLLDRATGIILNEDPLAGFPVSPIHFVALANANRFYQVEIVDTSVNPMQPRSDVCTHTAADYYFPSEGTVVGLTRLGDADTFYVTVGVSWTFQTATGAQELVRQVMSALLPI